jgi:hypothetical protein
MVKISEMSADLVCDSSPVEGRRAGHPGWGHGKLPLQRHEALSHVITEGFSRARALLEKGHASDALRLLNSQRYASPIFDNARAVCLMRLGRPEQALQILKPLVLINGNGGFRSHIPDIYKINLATALAMTGDVAAADEILDQLKNADITHPQMTELRVAIDRWQTGLSLWELFQWNLGAHVHHRVILHFVPGLIE